VKIITKCTYAFVSKQTVNSKRTISTYAVTG